MHAMIILGYPTEIRKQLYYNNGNREVVTSIHFVKIKTKYFAKPLGFEPSRPFSDLQSCAITTWPSTYLKQFDYSSHELVELGMKLSGNTLFPTA